MALEKKWEAIPPISFTINGGTEGQVTLPSTDGFKVKQKVILSADNLDSIQFEIKRVVSETVLLVGPIGQSIDTYSDISAYTTALSAAIRAEEQPRNSIPEKEYERAVFAEEPVVAKRVVPVDSQGRMYGKNNPIPVKTNTEWDERDLIRDGDDDIISVVSSRNGQVIETLNLEYNGEKSVIKVRRV